MRPLTTVVPLYGLSVRPVGVSTSLGGRINRENPAIVQRDIMSRQQAPDTWPAKDIMSYADRFFSPRSRVNKSLNLFLDGACSSQPAESDGQLSGCTST